MNKYEFMYRLNSELSALGIEDKGDIMGDYEEHFRMGLEAGKTDDEIVKELGNPVELAKSYLSPEEQKKQEESQITAPSVNKVPEYNYTEVPASKSKNSDRTLMIVLVVILTLFVALPLFSTLISIAFGLFSAAFGLLIVGIVAAIVLCSLSASALAVAGSIVLGIGIVLLGIVCGFLGVYGSYGIWKLGEWYVKMCKSAIKEG